MLKIHIIRNAHTKQWHWRAVSRNGRSIAIGGETYKTRAGAAKGLRAFIDALWIYGHKMVEPQAMSKPQKAGKK